MAIPLLLAVTAGLVWFLALGVAQVRVVDAARETARAAARGDSDGEAVALGQRVAPAGGSVTISRTGERILVTATAPMAPPVGLFSRLPVVTLEATAEAREEPSWDG